MVPNQNTRNIYHKQMNNGVHPLSSITRSLERSISPCLGVGAPVLFRVPTLRCRACEKRGEGGAGERHKGMLNIPLGRSVPLCPRRAAAQPLRADRGQEAASSLRDVVAWRSAALALPPSVYSILRPLGDVDVGEIFARARVELGRLLSCRPTARGKSDINVLHAKHVAHMKTAPAQLPCFSRPSARAQASCPRDPTQSGSFVRLLAGGPGKNEGCRRQQRDPHERSLHTIADLICLSE